MFAIFIRWWSGRHFECTVPWKANTHSYIITVIIINVRYASIYVYVYIYGNMLKQISHMAQNELLKCRTNSRLYIILLYGYYCYIRVYIDCNMPWWSLHGHTNVKLQSVRERERAKCDHIKYYWFDIFWRNWKSRLTCWMLY